MTAHYFRYMGQLLYYCLKNFCIQILTQKFGIFDYNFQFFDY